MKLSFWDILASMVMLGGLALATIFINIFINPYSFINPFPPPTPVASLQVPTMTPSQRSLPELWTATPETPGVPSVVSTQYTQTVTVTGTRLVLPTKTPTRTRTVSPSPSRTITRTPNRTLTSVAYKSPTQTTSASSDTTTPSIPGFPYCYDSSSDSTPTFTWSASSDSGTGVDHYDISWGLDSGGDNPTYTSDTNSWTAPTITVQGTYYIYVRAEDGAGNQSQWTEPNRFGYGGVGLPSVTTSSAGSIGVTSATLYGVVNPNSATTTVYFDYGTTSSYGTVVTLPGTLSGSSPSNVSTSLTGLAANTTYHYRARATNSAGTGYGSDLSFTTSNNPSTTTITSDGTDPSDLNTAYTVSVTVTGSGTPTGTVSVNDGSGATCTITLAAGSGTCNLTSTTAGAKTITASYSGDGSNASSSDTEAHTVNKGNPSVTTWPTASSISYGQTLASSTLSGGAVTPAGTFAFTTPGTTPDVGTAPQSVTFTPTDTTNYNTATGSADVTVTKADPTVTSWPTASDIVYGDTLADSTLTGGSASVAGSFAFTTPATTPGVGTTGQSVTFTPTDTTHYNLRDGTVNVTVNKADATITWPSSASAITYGQALSASTLSGDGSAVPTGTFAWTSPTTVPDAGTYTASVTFTPDDTTNYNTETNTINVTVNKASQTISFTSANPSPVTSGNTYTPTATASSGLTVTIGATGDCTIATGTVTFTTPGGSCTVTADQAGDSNYLAATQVTQVIAINP